jgi:hypothetical protein
VSQELSDREHFYAKTERTGGCWEWRGGKLANGYGHLVVRFGARRKTVLAHRYSFELHNGPIGAGLYVCHTCDNPGCVNPLHLFTGTPKDNAQDCVRKGRSHHPPGGVCHEGHRIEGDNAITVSGKVRCRTCRNAWARKNSKERRAAIREAKLAAGIPHGRWGHLKHVAVRCASGTDTTGDPACRSTATTLKSSPPSKSSSSSC